MPTAIEELTAQVQRAIAERRYQDAVRACRRVLLSQPDDVHARMLLAASLMALGRYSEVRTEMLSVLRADPDNAKAHRLVGEALLREGDPNKARQALMHARALNPQDRRTAELLVACDGLGAQQDWVDDAHTAKSLVPAQNLTVRDTNSVEIDPSLMGGEPVSAAHTVAAVLPPEVRSGRPPGAPRVPPRGPAVVPSLSRFEEDAVTQARRAPTAHDPLADIPDLGGDPRGPIEADHTQAHIQRSHVDDDDDAATMLHRAPTDELPVEPTQAMVRAPGAMLADIGEGRVLYTPFDETAGRAPEKRPSSKAPKPRSSAPQQGTDGPPRRSLFDPPAEEARKPSSRPAPSPRRASNEPQVPTRSKDARLSQRPPLPSARPSQPVPAQMGGVPLDAERPSRAPSKRAKPSALSDDLFENEFEAESPSVVMRVAKRVREQSQGGPIAKLILLVIIGVPLALVVAAVVFTQRWVHQQELEEVTADLNRALELARLEDYEPVLARTADTDDPELRALRAQALATLALEMGQPTFDEASALAVELKGQRPASVIAATYIALYAGDAPGATAAARKGRFEKAPAELHRARALAAESAGDLDRAVVEAEVAAKRMPGSARHGALHALLLARTGLVTEALSELEALDGADQSPTVRIARARVLQDSGSDPMRAAGEARAVLDELAGLATPPQIAFAELIRAKQAIGDGDLPTALEAARTALEKRPPGDESFLLDLVETFVRAREGALAERTLALLPAYESDVPRRAKLTAESAILNGSLEDAEAALVDAGEGAYTNYLRGRLAEARGQLGVARELYEQASTDPRFFVRARGRLGALELGRGRTDEAIVLLEPALERAPGDLLVVPLMVQALLKKKENQRAAGIVRIALSVHREAVELKAAQAQVDLANGRSDDALETLRAVTKRLPDSVTWQVAFGDAARMSGRPDEAKVGYERALELQPAFYPALVGLAMLALDLGDFETARARLKEAQSSGARGPEFAVAQGRLLVALGAGAEAVLALEGAVEGSSDAELWVLFGQAQLQAEKDKEANRAFARALKFDRTNADAHLGLAAVQIRAGQIKASDRSIENAERIVNDLQLSERYRGRLLVARSRSKFEVGELEGAERAAREALEFDGGLSDAHLVIALVAIERSEDPTEPLRRAVESKGAMPEAKARLALQLGKSAEGCRLASQYVTAAPAGYDITRVRELALACQR